MTTFNQIILICPHCGIKMTDYELMSFTIHNSTVYSDGLTVTEPWKNSNKAIALCPSCRKVFWREDARPETDEMPKEDMLSAGDVYDLPFALRETFREELIHFYLELLQKGFANTTERKVYLRFRIWWGINDFIRYREPIWKLLPQFSNLKRTKNLLSNRKNSRSTFAEFKPLFRENLEKLIAIFRPEGEEEQLLLAEMYRELGKMTKAREALLQMESTEKGLCKKIAAAISRNKRRVMKL